MNKADFVFPLPSKNLHLRYDPVFEAIKKGLNPSIVGLPQSSRSSFLKFIIEYNKKYLSEYIDPNKYKFIQIEHKDFPDNRYISSIAYEIFDDKIIKTNDPLLITASIKRLISENKLNAKYVFLIYELEKFSERNPETYKFIMELLKINKHNPENTGFQAIFITSPSYIYKMFHDKIIYFKLFSDKEMQYTRKRLEHFRGLKIESEVHNLSLNLSFGHYLLYKFLSDLSFSELKTIKKIKTHNTIAQLLETIWSGAGSLKAIRSLSPLNNPILLPPVSRGINERNYEGVFHLTAQERLLLDVLKTEERIFSRDEVAQIIWGANWTDKYSDWAIDKLVSKLKTKLVNSKYELLTMRGRGYCLKTNDN